MICHPEQSEGSASAVAFLSVIPEGNLLLSLLLPLLLLVPLFCHPEQSEGPAFVLIDLH